MAAGAAVVDVLGAKEYVDSHLPAAVDLPLEQLGESATKLLDPNRATVVYCYDSICDRSSRAAWRLWSLGFREVYDYVASKVDWMGAGLPYEGERAARNLATLADRSVPTCALRDKTRDVAERVGDAPMCVVVDEQGVVLGLVTRAMLEGENAVVDAVMEEGPLTFRPFKTAEEIAKKLDSITHPQVVVTTLDGKLVGCVDVDVIRGAA